MAYFDIESLCIFNLDSPSSSLIVVKQIWDDFVAPFGDTAKILDVGGTESGFMHKLPAEKRCNVCAVNTTQTKRIRYRRLTDVPEGEGPFALAMMFGVLMYMERTEVEYSFQRIHELLTPGGSIIVANPRHDSLLQKADHAVKRIFKHASKRYTPEELQEMLSVAGFINIQTTTDLTPPKKLYRLYQSRPYLVIIGERSARP